MSNRQGIYVKNLNGALSYKSFKPSLLPINPPIEIDNKILNTLNDAYSSIGKLNGIATKIPNINLFISMYIKKEALLSSQIEGTQCTLENILNPNVDKNTNMDVKDVVNYIKAYEYSIEQLNKIPICSRLLKGAHKILLQNTRGEEKEPGSFRRSQNWLGGRGSTISNARYIPPNVDDMNDALNNLDNFINEDKGNILINAALIHYQFETIHPFLDGNGRIGRLLIVLYLINKKVLDTPALYVSYYLKNHRIEYYDRMTYVRETGNYEQWVQFFLEALLESCNDAITSINKMDDLHNKNIQLINGSKKSILKVFNYLEENPIIDIKRTAEDLGLSYNTVSSAMNSLSGLGILNSNNQMRNRVFYYNEFLDILNSTI